MRKSFATILVILSTVMAFTACDDDETYAEQKEKERNAIAAFMERNPIRLVTSSGDSLMTIPKIKVITQQQFEAQDSMTNVDENEFVLFGGTGIYMQIVRQGVGEKLEKGKSASIICKYWEYNILGDSLQNTNQTLYWQSTPDIIDAYNNSGTISASFNITYYKTATCSMYAMYKSTSVPAGWLEPLKYVKIGRQTGEEGIAKVRLIVPHSQGTATATNNVYPCFYEITYQKTRF